MNERRATAWLLAMCVLWGSSFFTMKLGTAGVASVTGEAAAPAAFLFLRFLVSALLFPLVFPGVLRRISPRVVRDGTVLSLPFFAGFLLQVTGLSETSSTVSAFLTNLTVVITPLLGRVIFREQLKWGNLLGASVALAGVYVLTNPAGGGFGTGELLTVACAVAFAFQIQMTNVLTRRSHPEGITFVMFVSAVIYSGLTLLFHRVPPAAVVRALSQEHVVWTVLWTAAACSVAAITIMNRYQREIPPTRAAVLYTLEPVFAALLAAGFAGEGLTCRDLAGGGIILGGNLVCELWSQGKSRRRRRSS